MKRSRPLAVLPVLTVLALLPATAGAKDDCGDAAYCVPAPPASKAAQQKATKTARKALGVTTVVKAAQVSDALVYRAAPAVVTPRSIKTATVTLPVLSVTCPSACSIKATLKLTVGNATSGSPDVARRLAAGKDLTIPVTIRSSTITAITAAGAASLSVKLDVTDAYGTVTKTVKLGVLPAPKPKPRKQR
jgi:hypothetical protein